MKSKNKTVQHLGFIALAFAGFASTIAHAATDTWQGTVGSTDWATNGNWTYSTGSAIATGDSLVFTSANASASTTLTNTLATSFNVASMTYNSGALAYTMTGNAFNLTGSITNNSTSLQTINNAITLSNAAHTFTTTNANGGLALGGGFSGTTIQNVTFVGPGTITLGGTNTFNTKNGNFNALIVGGSVSGGASTGGNVSITGATTVDGTGFSDSRGFIDIHGNSTLTVQTGGSLTINGSSNASAQTQIGQNATGTSTLRVNGGSLTVSGAQGFLLGNNRADATGVLQISSGTATITAGNTTRGDARNQITLGRSAGNGRIDLDGGTLETGRYFIRGGAGTANFNFNGGTLKALANQTAGTGWFETATTITTTVKAGGAKIDTNGFDTNINTVLAHDSGLGGTADGGLTKSGTGTLTLAAANTYTGATKVSAGTLIADTATNATVLSASSNLVMAGGTFQLKGLALTDRTQTLNGLNVSLGASVVDANNLGTSTTLDLRGSGGSQVISRGSHATVDFKATTGTLGTTALIQAGTTNTNGLIGGWATVNGGTDFASNSTDTSSGYVVAATSSGGDLGDSGLASDSTLNFKPSGTQTDLTSAKAFNSLNFSGSTGATMTGSGAITAASGGVIYSSTGGITGGTLAGSASGELILHTTQALSLGSTSIIDNGGATALTKSGTATLTLGTTNTYSGNTTVNAGTLTLGASGSIANSPVIAIRSGATLDVSAKGGWSVQGADSSNRQTLTGSGSVTGATTIGNFGTHNAGDNGVGKQTLSSSLAYNSGSIFEWDLAATPATAGRGTAYDAVNAASLGSTTGAIFRVVLNGAQDFSSTFWDTNQTWTDIFKTGDAGTNLSFATIFSGGVQYYNESGVLTGVTSTQGAFTMSGSTLSWSAVPEPTSAMAGLLLTAGLLRRRRKN